ncbi:MAG: dihydrodipicolinate synthase family protein [Caldilineaceae bacterium]|nr:dihydrodipicolinate synthase family protein [Caldilineaceae bacterium]
MSEQPLRGVFAPVLTPFKSDLSPDVARWIDFCRQLLDDGCNGLCPFGTTSEANSLGMDERMDMLAQLVDAGVDPAILMPGTGTCAIPDTVKLTKHAVELGCGGVLMLPPFYYKGVSDDGLFRSIAEVIERVGDARLHIYLYHIPPIAQVGFPLAVLERLSAAYPHTVVGMKDSSGDWNNLQATLTALPDFNTFTGSEKFLLQTLRLGGAGTISAMANVIPGHLRRLYDGWLGEDAERLQEEANVMREYVRSYAPIPAIKAIIGQRAGDPAWRTVRPPLVAMDDAAAQELFSAMGLERGVAAD